MEREDAKDLTLSILVIVVALLAADCVWLHVKGARQADELTAVKAKLELQLNPPPEPTVADKAKEAYDRAKAATVDGFEKVKAAAAAGLQAVKDEYGK